MINYLYLQSDHPDFFGETPNIDKVLTERFVQENKPYNVNKGLIPPCEQSFRACQSCLPPLWVRSSAKAGLSRRRPILGEFGAQTVYLKRYRCKRCRKKFTTPLDSVVERNHRYTSVFKAKVNGLTKTGYRSLRKLRDNLATFFGLAPSHRR